MTHADENHAENIDFEESEERFSRKALLLFAAIAVAVLVDVAHDTMTGAELEHLLIEAGLVGLAAWGAHMFRKRWLLERARAAEQVAAAQGKARNWQVQAEIWRREAKLALEGLSNAIDHQFTRWKLSPAEREVASLLLKGLAMKEIAAVRSTSERTAREQARAVYRKGELAGRAELSAFFLEDLMAPAGER